MEKEKAAGVAIARRVKEQWGLGWKRISDEMRINAIASDVLYDVMNSSTPVDPATVRVIYKHACEAAGLT